MATGTIGRGFEIDPGVVVDLEVERGGVLVEKAGHELFAVVDVDEFGGDEADEEAGDEPDGGGAEGHCDVSGIASRRKACAVTG